MFYVYVIYNSNKDRFYIGQTGNLEKRLEEHNKKRGKHYTAKLNGEWTLIYKETLNSRSEAIKREKQLKSFKGREFIKKYIPR